MAFNREYFAIQGVLGDSCSQTAGELTTAPLTAGPTADSAIARLKYLLRLQ